MPHITAQLWQDLALDGDILTTALPEPDAEALRLASINLVVQINGKKRAEVAVPAEASDEEIRALILADAEVQRSLAGATPKKFVIVPGRLANLVV